MFIPMLYTELLFRLWFCPFEINKSSDIKDFAYYKYTVSQKSKQN